MAYSKIPEKEVVLLVRALGLLVNQAGVYGASHNVTRLTLNSVFAELEQAVKTFGVIEIALKDNVLLVNGHADAIDASVGKNLFDRMLLYKVGGLLFLKPLEMRDFTECINLFGTPPQVLATEGGFEEALKRANLRSVRAVTVAYQRVTGKAEQAEALQTPGVLDLSAAFLEGEGVGYDLGASLHERGGDVEQKGAARQQRASSLAALLRETAALLEDENTRVSSSRKLSTPAVLEALEQVRGLLSAMTVESERRITSLAVELDEDSLANARMEAMALEQGIGVKLTRGELIKRYAELNQEIMQPLTVSTGVLGMLSSGHAGGLTDSQQNLLKLAADSVQQVNQLVEYMSRISGLPETYTPDAGIIADAYR